MSDDRQPERVPDEPPTTNPPLVPLPTPGGGPTPGDGPAPLPPRTLPGTEESPIEAPDPGLPAPHATTGAR